MAGYVIAQVIRFGTNLVMTRLLAPEMYGVMTVATTIMIGLTLFFDLGLRQAVVQNSRGSDPRFLNTVWVTRIGIGGLVLVASIIVAAILWGAADLGMLPLGTAYAEPSMPFVVAALGFGGLLSGLESTKTMEASRHLALVRLTQMQILAQLAGLAVMLGLSLHVRSIWILVSGSLATTAVATLLSHFWLPGTRNVFQWERDVFREVMQFGRWVLFSSALGFVATLADKGLLAGIISAPALGIYSIAALLLGAAEQVVVKVVNDIAFPAISEVSRQRPADLKRTIYRIHALICLVSGGLAGLLLVLGPAVISFLYDTRYHDAGWMLQILSVTLLALPTRVHAVSFLALGKSRLQFNLTVFHVVAMWTLIPIGASMFGLEGALWAISVAHFIGVPAVLYLAHTQGTLDIKRELLLFGSTILGVLVGLGALKALG
jgi:O-antigen/teichoic acid export membrane protein